MQQVDGGKEHVLTRGGLTDVGLNRANGVKLAVSSQQKS